MVNLWLIYGPSMVNLWLILVNNGSPQVNMQKTMENHHAINGKTHYFVLAIFYVANCSFTRRYVIDGKIDIDKPY